MILGPARLIASPTHRTLYGGSVVVGICGMRIYFLEVLTQSLFAQPRIRDVPDI